MQYPDTINEFLYQYEILRTKLEIRDHYFKTIVRGIHENTGQILSLVQIQLAIVENQIKDQVKTDILTSRNLIGRAIYDLRDMGRNLFPEDDILSESGLINALKRELTSYSANNILHKIMVKGIPFALSPDNGLVFFLVILEIVTVIINQYGVESLQMVIMYSNTKLKISISYSGVPINFHERKDTDYPSSTPKPGVHERLNLIGGYMVFKTKTTKRVQLDISVPYKTCKAA